MNETLPPEIVNAVLLAVPPTHQAVAARVCREWRDLIVRAGRSHHVLYRPRAISPTYVKGGSRPLANMLVASAMRGESLLEWAVEQGCPHAHYAAARRGDVRALERLDPPKWKQAQAAMSAAASEGHLETLEWMVQRGGYAIFTIQMWKVAAAAGRVDVLRWLYARDSDMWPHRSEICMMAAERGHLAVLEWARKSGLLVGEVIVGTMREAAERGRVDSLGWLWDTWPEHPCWPEIACMVTKRGPERARVWFATLHRQQ